MNGLICNQNDIPKEEHRYGFRSSAATGCGWIATYNALKLMGYRAEPEKLIRYYQRRFPVVNGNFGTFIFNLTTFFKERGFPVEMTARWRELDPLARRSDACILFYVWRSGCTVGSHYVALRHDGRTFVGYNTYSNSTGPDEYGPNLEDFLRRRRYFFPILIGIRDRRKEAVN